MSEEYDARDAMGRVIAFTSVAYHALLAASASAADLADLLGSEGEEDLAAHARGLWRGLDLAGSALDDGLGCQGDEPILEGLIELYGGETGWGFGYDWEFPGDLIALETLFEHVVEGVDSRENDQIAAQADAGLSAEDIAIARNMEVA